MLTAYGFFPVEAADGKWTLLTGAIPGKVVQESLNQDVQVKLTLKVSSTQYARAEVVRQAWADKKDYKLIESDCATFVEEVAKSLGLRSPDRGKLTSGTWFPSAFLLALVEMNEQSHFFQGRWESSDARKRWVLEFTDADCIWTERSKTGASLTRTVAAKPVAGVLQIERPNDKDVLTFLDARSGVVDQILAAGPKASFMNVTRTSASTLVVGWNGLAWELDKNDKLKTLIQPGTTPKTRAQFDLKRL